MNPRYDHPMFGKSYEFKGSNPYTVMKEFIQSLRRTADQLNAESEWYHIEPAIFDHKYIKEFPEIERQTHCFVCKESFVEVQQRMIEKEKKKGTYKGI